MSSSAGARMLAELGLLGKIVYWLAVLVVSLIFLVLLVRFIESRDGSELDGAGAAPALMSSAA